jgi:CRP/FNR family transcriptional regulator, cyclic AMP receptor protein
MHLGEPTETDDGPPRDPYRVVSIPATDVLFRHTVDRQVRSARQRGGTLRRARKSLRQRYPQSELSCQRGGKIRGESVDVWFAYREGRREAVAPQARWRHDRGLARVVVDPSGRLIRANAACQRLLELPPGNAGAITVCDIVSRELGQELLHEWKRRPAGEAWVGSLPLGLLSGRRLDIEFNVRADRTGQRLDVAMRSLADRDRANDWTALGKSALGSMPTALLRELLRDGARRKLESGERFATSLTEDAWVVLITAGIMRLYVALDGYEPTLAYGNQGSLFGTHAVVPTETSLLGLQAVTPSVLLQLSTRRVRELARSKPTFARALSGDVRLQLNEVVRAFAAHAAGNLLQRLAREIVVLSDLHADDELLPVTEQQLADGIGSIRESVGRSIGDLRRDGLIATTRHGLLILDKGGLREAGNARID